MELAKLLGMLDKLSIDAGATLFRQGDLGDAMFIVESGSIELFTSAEDGAQHSITVLSEGEVLGEMAMLTGEVRSASAIALSEASLFVIDRKMFDRLIAENHKFSSFFIKLLSQRLVATNHRLQSAKESESQRMLLELDQLPEALIRFLLWCSYLPVVSKELIEHAFDFSFEDALAAHPFLKLYFHAHPAASERVQLEPSYLSALRIKYNDRYSDDEKKGWLADAIMFCESMGDWAAAIELQGGSGQWEGALGTYIRAQGSLQDKTEDLLSPLIGRCPVDVLAEHHAALSAYLNYCVRHAPEKGQAVLESALSRDHSYSSDELLLLYEQGMELYRRVGKQQQALEYAQLAAGAENALTTMSKRERIGADRVYELAKRKLARRRSERLARSAEARASGNRTVKLIVVTAAILLIILSFLMEPAGGLSQAGIRFIGIALAAVLMWIVNVIPDYIVALGMIMLWIVGGIASPELALSGFASSTWLFMIFIMAISAVIMKSGISYRFALYGLKRFPASYRGQLWGIVAGGTLLNPLLPSSSAKVSLGVPMAQTLSESMGFDERSKGAAGLGLVSMVFFGFTAPFVMTGSYTNVMAYGLAARDGSVSWLQWFLYALPAFIVFGGVMLALLFLMFRNVAPAKMVTGEVLDEQLKLLGPLTRDEKISLWTIIGCIALMIAQPWHGIDSTWVMLAGFAVLIISGVLDKETMSTGIDWTFLLFLGAAFSFAGMTEQLGIAELLSAFLGEHLALFLSSPVLFLTAVVLISFLVTLIIRDDPAVILLITAIVPLGEAAGIHPWVLVFIILLATDPFFFSYQSPTYLTAYYSAEGKAFTHRQAQKAALGYGLAVLLVAILCVPYWKWLNLIP